MERKIDKAARGRDRGRERDRLLVRGERFLRDGFKTFEESL